MATKKSSPALEDSLKRLEHIVTQMEQGDIPLEESIKLYEEGIALAKSCAEKLQQAELTIKQLGKNMEGHFSLLDEESE